MAYRIQPGDTLANIAKAHQTTVNQLLSLNPALRANPNMIRVGDQVVLPDSNGDSDLGNKSNPAGGSGGSVPASTGGRGAPASVVADGSDPFTVPHGQLTFDAEGMESPGPYFSRVPHVPSASSGVTIGRGYDLSQRSVPEAAMDLNNAGVDELVTQKFVGCVGLKGDVAEDYLDDHDLHELEITPEQQKVLFTTVYEELKGDVLRICGKADVLERYGETDWQSLPSKMADVVIDLRYRGDYTPFTRQKLQPLLVKASDANTRGEAEQQFVELMADKTYWRSRLGVPLDRFRRRRDYLS